MKNSKKLILFESFRFGSLKSLWKHEDVFDVQFMFTRRLIAFTYQDQNFDLIFGDINFDLNTSDLKGRFDIPDRGLALKKIETCFNS